MGGCGRGDMRGDASFRFLRPVDQRSDVVFFANHLARASCSWNQDSRWSLSDLDFELSNSRLESSP